MLKSAKGMKREIREFVAKCLFFQHVKVEHQKPSGLLQPIMILEWRWERVTMDSISGLPVTLKKKDLIWVIVDRFTKSAHFIPVRIDFSLERLAELYVSEINKLHEALGTKLNFNIAFHPQTDEQSE
ncbi:integrase [Gossypium australe]|uniref:Integrase n=1 Tax=Gossypium australe TaxID=47621 RepID=A0A5B6WGQ2_9ROSI|nr:integrase [Gossypium australe]